jgi:hypothetical protein
MVWTALTVVQQLEFAALFVLCFPDGDRMRSKLSRCLYLLLVDFMATYLVVVPVYAFQASSSTTGYVRSMNLSGASAMFAANRASTIASIASAASSGGAASLALRFVTGGGWIGLGVMTPGRPGHCSLAPARTHWGCRPNSTLAAMRAHRGGMGVS